jgi:hypothetical protein
MRLYLLVLLLLPLLAGLLPAPVGAVLMPVDVTYAVEGLARLTPIAAGSGTADVNGGGGGAHLTSLVVPGWLASAMTTSTPTVTPTLSYTKVIATVGAGTGTLTETTGGVLRGVMPLTGNVRLCFFLDCLVNADIPLTQNGTQGVGIGGPPITVTVGGAVTISLTGAPWSTGTLSAVTSLTTIPFTVMGFARGPGALTSSTAVPGGSVQMVTPIRVTATQGDLTTVLDLFGVFSAQLVPEPASGALLLSGAAGLLLLGRARH